MKRIIPFILTFAIVFSLSVPFASADTATPQEIADMDIVTFFQAVVHMFSSDDDELGGFGSNGAFSGGGSTFGGGGFGKDSSGNYTSQKVKADYETYVSDLPTSLYSSSGVSCTMNHVSLALCGFGSTLRYCSHSGSPDPRVAACVFSGSGGQLAFTPDSGTSRFPFRRIQLNWSVVAPVSGTYYRQRTLALDCSYGTPDSGLGGFHRYYTEDVAGVYYNQGETITYSTFFYYNANDIDEYIYCSYVSGNYYSPVLKILPTTSLVSYYSNNSRAASIIGDYGVIGSNNTVTNIGSQSIVNETDSSVYNPITGDTTTYDSWTYDYSSRTYSFTVSNDDNSVSTSTVEYGDENITITEGDTTYNIYYLVSDNSGSGSGSGSGTGDSHTHSYTSTVTTEPSCILPGVRTKTCSCGDTFTESIPATGHYWEVKDQVLTEYDDSGQIVTSGYVIYKCSVCDEEYKSTDGSAPPNSAGSNDETGSGIISKIATLLTTIMSGIWEVLKVFIGFLLDCLTDLFSMIAQCFASVAAIITDILATIPTLFTGFIDFLALVFPFLPDDLITILTFGILAVVVIGIIRAIRRW